MRVRILGCLPGCCMIALTMLIGRFCVLRCGCGVMLCCFLMCLLRFLCHVKVPFLELRSGCLNRSVTQEFAQAVRY